MKLIKSKIGADDVVAIFDELKNKAIEYAQRGKFEHAIKYIRTAAHWAYSLNFKYYDNELEVLIKDIAKKTLSPISLRRETADLKRIVLITTIGLDNHGLTQQYLRAFMSLHAEILYVSVEGNIQKSKDIIFELNSYVNAQIIFANEKYNKHNNIDKSQYIVDAINDFCPDVIFLHLMPWDVISLLVTESIHGILKYNINLTDHAFWLGASFIDYNLEFRPFGMTISLEQRNLSENQLLYLPYYPIFPKIQEDFQGFPELPPDSIRIFTGGAFYKMFGDNGRFFNLMDAILSLSERVVILIAGAGDTKLLFGKIKNLKNHNRVYYIGNRKDINEVFKHVDIYLDTYPLCGGLMEQYAFINAKPVIIYNKLSALGSLDSLGKQAIKYFTNIKDCLSYANQLIIDENYRKEEGRKNLQVVTNEYVFNSRFKRLLLTNSNMLLWSMVNVDYIKWKDLYLEIENDATHRGTKRLISDLGVMAFRLFPQKGLVFIKSGLLLIMQKIHKYIS